MILRPEQLAAHLDKPLAPLYVLHGNEPLLVLEAGDAIRAAARRQGFAEREVLVAGQGFRWSELQSVAGNLSLFGASKLIDLRIPNGKPGRDGGEALQRYARHPDDGVVTLISLPELDWATRKAAWFVALLEAGVGVELNAPERDRLPDWIAQRLARQQQRASQDALRFIAEHVEGNLLAAHQEILKLGLLHPPGDLPLDPEPRLVPDHGGPVDDAGDGRDGDARRPRDVADGRSRRPDRRARPGSTRLGVGAAISYHRAM